MNKKTYWLIALISVLMLTLILAVGCNNTEQSNNEETTLSISNKMELTEKWRVGDDDRTLVIALTGSVKNQTATVTSDNASVISVSGYTIHAVASGEAVVTASVTKSGKTYTDSLEITVSEALTFTISNKSEIAADWVKNEETERTLSFAISDSSVSASEVTVTSSNPDVVTADGKKLTALRGGTAVITATLGSLTDTVTVTVVVNAELTVASASGNYFIGTEFEIPAVLTAISSFEDDVTDDVVVTASAGLTLSTSGADAVASASEIGRYTITYTLNDSKLEEPLVKEVTLEVVKEIFAGSETGIGTGAHNTESETASLKDAGLTISLEETDGGYSQYVTSEQNNLLFGKLKGNNGEASTYYYASATYTTVTEDIMIGLGHMFVTETTQQPALLFMLACNTGDVRIADVVFNKNPNINIAVSGVKVLPYSYKIFDARYIQKNSDAAVIKISVIREGDYFYTFVNDQYVNCVTYEQYRNTATVPAISVKNMGSSDCATQIRDIVYLYEEEAVTKVANELLGENKQNIIVPYSGNGDSATSTYYKSFLNASNVYDGTYKYTTDVNDTDGTRGLAFDYNTAGNFNDSVVSPYIYFDGNFTFEWEYKATDTSYVPTASGKEQRMMLEMRSFKYGNEFIQMGGIYNAGTTDSPLGATKSFYGTVLGYTKKNGYYTYGEQNVAWDDSLGARYTLTRILKEDHSEIIMTCTSIANPSQTFTRIITWGGLSTDAVSSGNYQTAQADWDQPVLLLWHNTIAGQYSNIKWSVLSDSADASDFITESVSQYTAPAGAYAATAAEDGSMAFTVAQSGLYEAVIDFGENAVAGNYTVTFAAVTEQLDSSHSADLTSSVLYTFEVELAQGMRYVTVDLKDINGDKTGFVIGQGRYTLSAVSSDASASAAAAYLVKTGKLYAEK